MDMVENQEVPAQGAIPPVTPVVAPVVQTVAPEQNVAPVEAQPPANANVQPVQTPAATPVPTPAPIVQPAPIPGQIVGAAHLSMDPKSQYSAVDIAYGRE